MKKILSKALIWMLIPMFLMQIGYSFTIYENFNTLPENQDTNIWTRVNNTYAYSEIINTTIAFYTNVSGNQVSTNYYKLNKDINGSDDINLLFYLSCGATEGTAGYIFLQSSDELELNANESEHTCKFGLAFHKISDIPAEYGYTLYLWDGYQYTASSHPEFKGAGQWELNQLQLLEDEHTGHKNVSWAWDGVLQENLVLSSDVCDNLTNITLMFGSNETDIYNVSGQLKLDSLQLTATATDDVPLCAEPCIYNESFNYDDNPCLHGWEAGDCNDLNIPVNGEYICNGSSQMFTYPFGRLTKNSGLISIKFSLEIKSDYEVLVGFSDENSRLALAVVFDENTITDLRDDTNITTYAYNTSYDYEFIVDLQNYEYDFYKDNVLVEDNLPFYQQVDNIYRLFFQPDYNKGYPYCDYVLDDVVITKEIAVLPDNGTNYMIGDYLSVDWNNPYFDEEAACKENEHPQICFARVMFQTIMTPLTNFVFDNFLLFMVFIIILLMVVIIKKNK